MKKVAKSSDEYGKASMRQRLYRFAVFQRIHRLNWVTLFTLFGVLTFSASSAYFGLSLQSEPDGISTKCPKNDSQYSFKACLAGESLYFSIATETTVGYGDLAPQGWSRPVACLQAIFGLLLAGLFLGKIASLPTRATRQLIEKCTGHWVEFCETRRQTMISFVTITYKDSLVHYCGENFDTTGARLESFSGHIEPSNFTLGSRVAFWYSNKVDFQDFYEGTTTLRFLDENNASKQFTRFTGVAEDTLWGLINMCGYRVKKDEKEHFRSEDNASKRGLALRYLAFYKSDTRQEVQQVREEGIKRVAQRTS